MPYAHNLVKRLFLSGQLPTVQRARRLKHFVKKWELLTKDHSILETMTGYQLPFLSQPLQQELPQETDLNLKGEYWRSLEKGYNRQRSYEKDFGKSQFVSNLFLVKKMMEQETCYQFEESNSFYPTTISKWRACNY